MRKPLIKRKTGFCRLRENCLFTQYFEVCQENMVECVCTRKICLSRHPKAFSNYFIPKERPWRKSWKYLNKEQIFDAIMKQEKAEIEEVTDESEIQETSTPNQLNQTKT